MNAVHIIEEMCKKYSGIKYNKDSNSIIILPATSKGFSVCYNFKNGTHYVSFLGWHEEFYSEKEAFNCFVLGLSNECRLKVQSKGDFQYGWTLEAKNEKGNWEEDSTTGLLFFPFWRKTTTVILQNDFIV